MANKHWMEEVAALARERISQAEPVMRQSVAPAMLRRPDTKDIIAGVLAGDPAALPPQGRDRLAQYLTDTYGEAARHVMPYLGLDAAPPEEDPFG